MPRPHRAGRAYLLGMLLTLSSAVPVRAAEVQRSEQDGIEMGFSVEPLSGGLTAGNDAIVAVTLRQTGDGKPLRGAGIGGWFGLRERHAPPAAGTRACTAMAASFSQGNPLTQPALDLNGYYLVSLNGDSSLSVIDPLQGFGGSHLVAAPVLAAPGADWALTPDRRSLVVSEPAGGRVAIIDGASWHLLREVPLPNPLRLLLAPDSSQPWIAYTAAPADDGVALLDLPAGAIAARLPTGAGPHDLAFSADGHSLAVTNRTDRTVSIVDPTARRVTGSVPLTARPASVAYAPRARLFYVASEDGMIAAIDPASRAAIATIRTDPGPIVVRVAPDGRFALAANRDTGQVLVIDTATNQIIQTVTVGDEPDQIVFSDELVYIRQRRSDTLTALPLAQIGKEGQAIAPAKVAAGQFALGPGDSVAVADAIIRAPGHAAVVVANPADGTLYYYHEGMPAPQASFDNVGIHPAALLAADRSLRETAAGRYETVGRLPGAGTYDAVFYVDTPRLVQCFTVTIDRRPGEHATPRVAFTAVPKAAQAGQQVDVAFQLIDPESGTPVRDARDVEILTFRQPGDQQTHAHATPSAGGVYAASFRPRDAGSYYVFVQSQSLALRPASGALVAVSPAVAR